MINYNELIKYAKDIIYSNSRVNKYPFRDRYSHTLRVLKLAERLQEKEGGDIDVIKIAAIFHDTGWSDIEAHGIVSKRIADVYLSKINYDSDKKGKILEAIENHSSRENTTLLSIESYILMDADILDEVGALSILWDGMASTYEDDPSYVNAYNRIQKYTTKIKDRRGRLKTATGKEYYEEKIEFIDRFIKELEFELNI